MTDSTPPPGPADTVIAYLRATEARDLEAARGFLADNVEMVFPGDRRFTALEQIVANSGGRYRRVAKRIEVVDVAETDGRTVVYCHGTLYGAWLDGEAFEGIRFIDRFVLVDGRIVSQEVWNDTAEIRLQNDRGSGAG